MSLDIWVINGHIPERGLKSALTQGKIKGSRLEQIKNARFGIRYDKHGVWTVEEVKKGNVTWFKEWAGGHGSEQAMQRLIDQLEKIFHCDITADYDDYKEWVKKSTGKPVPKDPFEGCGTIIYDKKHPDGYCADSPRSFSHKPVVGMITSGKFKWG
jgi:hypothetical protein